jgi:hypothetical protein
LLLAGLFLSWLGSGRLSLGYVSTDTWERTVRMLSDANVAVYPVDAEGLIAAAELSSAYYPRVWLDPSGSESLQAGVLHVTTGHAGMNYVAKMTGGQAYYNNNNNILKMMERATEDSGRYYMLSYYLDREHRTPGWHNLKVRVRQEKVSTRARTGFFINKLKPDSDKLRVRDKRAATASPFEYTALLLTLTWTGKTAAGKKTTVNFQVHIPAETVLIGGDGQDTLNLDVVTTVADASGKVALSVGGAVHRTLEAASVQEIQQYGVTYVDRLEIDPGEYAVRLVVRDNLTGRLGSITAPLGVKSDRCLLRMRSHSRDRLAYCEARSNSMSGSSTWR